MNRYYSFNEYCRDRFGEKVYRLSLNAGLGCPNRDGTKGTGGCAFCSAGGSGDFAADASLSITEQIREARQRLSGKTGCRRFVAYFQAYTNTYAPVEQLRPLYEEAIYHPDIVALSIATRSDCLDDEVIRLLAELSRIKPVWVELGLQTIHNRTLLAMHTETTFEDFQDALGRLRAASIPVIAHLILGLPGETPAMMRESAAYIASSGVSGVKFTLLHILKGTALAAMYEEAPFPVFSLEEYCDLVIDCVEMLPPDMVIHRLTGDGPKKLLIAPLWSADKKHVLNTLNRRFAERDSRQGKEYPHG
jgi:hypothetical protein